MSLPLKSVTVRWSEARSEASPKLERVTVFLAPIPQLITGVWLALKALSAAVFRSSHIPIIPSGKT